VKELDISEIESAEAKAIRKIITEKVVGQEEGVNAIIDILERYHAGLHDPSRPIGSALFLGPTGTGKTRVIEALCEAIGNSPHHCVKVDCGEFQHSHEIAKLIGSPPGYLGHRETPARFTQKTIDGLFTPNHELAIIFFDEIEKASDALWHLLLSILDKATITLGDNSTTNFKDTIILMTSNAGGEEMDRLLRGGGMGFSAPGLEVNEEEIAEKGKSAARKKFTPEFLNRLDRIIAFHTLSRDQIKKICDLELDTVQQNIISLSHEVLFIDVKDAAKGALIEEGYDPKYNGRNIRRVIEQRISLPLSRIIAAGVTKQQDTIQIDYNEGYVFRHIEKDESEN
jgi:ATP-dependent Clp protease ATP-binding subunit ClpB